MPPQAGRVGSTSRPRKLRPASALIARCRLFGIDKFEALNRKGISANPVADLYTVLEHSNPDSTGVFTGSHLGQRPQTFPTLVSWLKIRLA